MTFNAANGTRGGRPPKANPLMNWVNNRAVNRIRRRGGKIMGSNLLVLNTVGKKTGAQRANPVAWFPWDDGSWLIVASAGGSARNPAWFHNLGGNPDNVSIDVDRSNVPVAAEQLQGAERDRAWASITTAAPQFGRYETKTDRRIPVIRLVRASAAG
jgi:deazaflavin-dependent oxidoreductase (nitroreductase family)